MKNSCNVTKLIPIFFQTVTLTVFPAIAASLLIRNLGYIIGLFVVSGENNKFDFGRIFEQTRDARLVPHLIIPLILAIAFSYFVICFFSKIQNKPLYIIAFVISFINVFCLSFVFSIMLTRVNGICFYDLLAKLIPLIDKL